MRPVKYVAPLLLLCLTSLPSAVRAAAPAEGVGVQVPKLFGTFTPTPGAWAEYEVVEKGSTTKATMKMAIVGKEGDSTWYEVTNTENGARNVIKMLVKGSPNESENIVRLILQSGDNPPTEMPRDFVVMGRKMATSMYSQRSGVPKGAEKNVRVEDLGEKSVEVPAGTFKGMEKRLVEEDGKVLSTYLYYPQVPPFGIIVSESESTTMRLLAYGSDAKSSIVAEPVKLTMPRGMPDMPRGMPPGMDDAVKQKMEGAK
jgi:hypothetical protein